MGVAEVGHSLSSHFHLLLKGFSLKSKNILQQLCTCVYVHLLWTSALQRDNTENSKKIFPEEELRGVNPISTFMCL
jgi:hypothetical protein